MGCAQRNLPTHPRAPGQSHVALLPERARGEGPFRKLILAVESVWTMPSPGTLRHEGVNSDVDPRGFPALDPS
jgi:hypothetical protein